jgi:hypothetical protein
MGRGNPKALCGSGELAAFGDSDEFVQTFPAVGVH